MIDEQITDQCVVADVVSKALIRASCDLGLRGSQLARTTGLSEATISRARKGTFQIAPGTKSYEISLMVIRIHQALSKILGSDVEAMRSWMKTWNSQLNDIPANKIQTIRGLMSVMTHVEMRVARN
jgi:predicted transcriptional regulator